MKFYKFHIGDFRSATAHLSNEEEATYRRLLDWYYDTEEPIPLDIKKVARRLRVSVSAVKTVLSDFFEKTDNGWRNGRCDKEIADYRAQANANKIVAQEREQRRKMAREQAVNDSPPVVNDSPPVVNDSPPVVNDSSTIRERFVDDSSTIRERFVDDSPPNHKPLTTNQYISPPVVPPLGGLDPAKPVRATRLTIEELPVPWREFCEQERPDLQPEAVWAQFRDYWLGKPGKDGRKQNWLATWRYWVRNQREAKPNGKTNFDRHLAAVKAVCDYDTATNF